MYVCIISIYLRACAKVGLFSHGGRMFSTPILCKRLPYFTNYSTTGVICCVTPPSTVLRVCLEVTLKWDSCADNEGGISLVPSTWPAELTETCLTIAGGRLSVYVWHRTSILATTFEVCHYCHSKIMFQYQDDLLFWNKIWMDGRERQHTTAWRDECRHEPNPESCFWDVTV